jgi:hypothetical protein
VQSHSSFWYKPIEQQNLGAESYYHGQFRGILDPMRYDIKRKIIFAISDKFENRKVWSLLAPIQRCSAKSAPPTAATWTTAWPS